MLNEISFSNEMMFIPQTEITLPIEYLDLLSGWDEVALHLGDLVFTGIVTNLSVAKDNETITADLEHIVKEWEFRQVPTNFAVKDTFGHLASYAPFWQDGWEGDFNDGIADVEVDYVFSRQNRLEAMGKVMELTPDYFWRVGFTGERLIEFGKFGEKKNIILSKKPSGKHNVRIITDPEITHNFSDVVNMTVPYGDRSDSGMSSLTLRDVLEHGTVDEMFPIVVISNEVNNERDYSDYENQDPSLGPNNEYEFAVVDTESVALEGNTIHEGTISFNDVSPFIDPADKEAITDEDRIKASQEMYDATIRKLKAARRTLEITMTTEPLPPDINVGDMVRFIYDNTLIIHGCSDYEKTMLKYDDWFYVTKLERRFAQDIEVDTVTLEKYLTERA